MHIAFFNRSFYPDTSATGQLLTELCESLVKQYGWRVSVVAGVPLIPAADSKPISKGFFFSREEYRGIEILRARGTSLSKDRFIGRFANYISYFLSAAWAAFRLDRPDVVVAQTDPPIIGLAAWLAARRFRIPFVMIFQDIFPEVGRLLEDFSSQRVDRILQRVNRFLVKRATRIVALGETMKKRLVESKGADPAKVTVIHNWTDCSAIRPAAKSNGFAAQYALDSNFIVMHSGNMGLSQGLEKVIESAAMLQDHEDIRFVFVGEGVKKPILQRKVQDKNLLNVMFLPFTPKEKLIDSFAAADVFIVSLKAGLAGYIVPSKLYGILAAGRPFVAAVEPDCEAASIASEWDCGIVVENNAESVAEGIMKLYNEPELRIRMGQNARRAALQFDRPVIVEKYQKLFEQMHAGNDKGSGLSYGLKRAGYTPISKRFFDVFLSGLGLLGSSPLWLVISAIVKLQDGGPIFYGAERVGRFGRRFKSWKFRSMIPESDKLHGPRQAEEGDKRITPFGRILRATAMDELPQLWNIFKGEMSFVGPRALLPEENEIRGDGKVMSIENIAGYHERHQVIPGLTGVAQIYAPRDIPRKNKFRLDLLYIRRWRFWLDMKLILLSFWITFRGRWEHRGHKVNRS
jgi:colanic acid biosynthesis glycosyl transferase WcaI